jgi:hypothetical protein
MTVIHGRFQLGRVVTTRGALETIKRLNVNPVALLIRHVQGDWGDLDEDDKKENEISVLRHLRILSTYKVGDKKLWIITEADRSITTILLPEEY